MSKPAYELRPWEKLEGSEWIKCLPTGILHRMEKGSDIQITFIPNEGRMSFVQEIVGKRKKAESQSHSISVGGHPLPPQSNPQRNEAPEPVGVMDFIIDDDDE